MLMFCRDVITKIIQIHNLHFAIIQAIHSKVYGGDIFFLKLIFIFDSPSPSG